MCSTPDIAATVLDLCGVKPHPQVQGKSFRDVLEGSASRCRPFIVTAVGFPTQGPGSSPGIATAMLNDGRYTYLYGGTDERPELYDLRDDPEQKKNLIRKDTARARAMHKKFIRWLEEIESPKQHIEARIDPGF